MQPKYIILLVFIFVLLHLALIPLGNEVFDATAAQHLNNVSSFGITTQSEAFGIMSIPAAGISYFSSLIWIMLHGFVGNPLFIGSFQLIGWMVLAPIFAAYAFLFIYLFYSMVRLMITA